MKDALGPDGDILISHVMQPQDANPAGNVHGGVIMRHIDSAAGVVAMRHARCNVVTVSIDRLDFHHPVYVGDLVTLRAKLLFTGRTSMEIGVRALAENMKTGKRRLTATAFLTFVALDAEGRPQSVPQLVLETEADRKRHKEALARRKSRLESVDCSEPGNDETGLCGF